MEKLNGVLDYVHGDCVGCEALRDRIDTGLPNLKYHMFGHIHETHGTLQYKQVICMNSSIMNGSYKFVNKPQFLWLDEK